MNNDTTTAASSSDQEPIEPQSQDEAPAAPEVDEVTVHGQQIVGPTIEMDQQPSPPTMTRVIRGVVQKYVLAPTVEPQRKSKPRALFKVPKVEITAEVMRLMTEEVMANSHLETSWGLYGLRDENNSVVVCGVLMPDRSVRRTVGNTVFGSPHYGEEIRWLMANYELRKKRGLAPANTVLEFLFKGHSHHTLGMRQYSGVDIASIKDAVAMGMEVAIGPLANIDKGAKGPSIRQSGEFGALVVESSYAVTFHFYYLSQQMIAMGMKEPELVEPSIRRAPLDYVPPSCWKFQQPELFHSQVIRLQSHGCEVEERWSVGKEPTLRLDFKLTKPEWDGPLTIRTKHNFPTSAAECILPDGTTLVYTPSNTFMPGISDLLTAVIQLEQEGKLNVNATVQDSGSLGSQPS